MKYLITGATGFIGNNVVQELLNRQQQVSVLVRSKQKIPTHQLNQISVYEGDLSDLDTIDQAMKSCDYIFHMAAFANIWSKDKMLAYKTNVEGTRNILNLALKNGIKKVVFTSSAATLTPFKRTGKKWTKLFRFPKIT